jgi:hypothetical protein
VSQVDFEVEVLGRGQQAVDPWPEVAVNDHDLTRPEAPPREADLAHPRQIDRHELAEGAHGQTVRMRQGLELQPRGARLEHHGRGRPRVEDETRPRPVDPRRHHRAQTPLAVHDRLGRADLDGPAGGGVGERREADEAHDDQESDPQRSRHTPPARPLDVAELLNPRRWTGQGLPVDSPHHPSKKLALKNPDVIQGIRLIWRRFVDEWD